MRIEVLGSSSSGNCYIIEDKGQILILEAGVKMQQLKKALGFDFKPVVGCLVSHEHHDHSGYIFDLMRLGVKVYASETTFKGFHHNKVVVSEKEVWKIGGYTFMPFNLEHDVPNLGYVIKTPSGKKIMFATDTQFIMQRFKDIDVYMLECNFDLDSMRKAIKCGKLDPMILVRVAGTHMSLETLKAYLENADLSKTQQIVLVHLSENNSNQDKYVESIQEQTGITTVAADKDVVIELLDGPEF